MTSTTPTLTEIYEVRVSHYREGLKLDHPDFDRCLRTQTKKNLDLEEAVKFARRARGLKIKGTEERTVVECLIRALKDDGTYRPLSKSERQEQRYIIAGMAK